jgi:MFS family permease
LDKARVIPPIINIVIIAFFIGAIANMPYVVWSPYAESLSAPFSFIGLTASLAELGYAIFQPLSGRLSDTKGRKIVMSISTVFFLISSVFFSMIIDYIWILPALFLYRAGASFFDPGYHASTDEASIPERRGRSFGYAWAFRIAGGGLGGLTAGFVADFCGFSYVFWVIIGLVIILLIVVQFIPDRRINNKINNIKKVETKLPNGPKDLKRKQIIRRILIVCSVDAFAWSIYGLIFPAMLTATFGFTYGEIGLITFVQYGALIPFQILFGHLSDKLGRKSMFLISEIIGIATITGYIFSSELIYFVLLQIPMAIVGASFLVGFYPILMDYARIDKKAEVLGRFSFIRILIAIPGPTIGGFIFQIMGYGTTLMTSLILVALTFILMLFLLPKSNKTVNY